MPHYPIAARGRFTILARRVPAGHVTRAQVVQVTLPPDAIFLLGDSAVSEDSRVHGPFDAAEIVGRVIAVPGRDPRGHPQPVGALLAPSTSAL